MTEIPYPYPYWFGSTAPPEGIQTVTETELPSLSTGDPAQDLRILERVLLRNGYHPIYVDLTREELEIPVVKVLVPGLEMTTVLDRFSPLSLRKFAHYAGAAFQ
jgi:ribosomal protein S12 methylthiotransferase accessory factor YcaO